MLETMTKRNELKEIIKILKKCKGNIYIQMHNNPDPDSIGSGFGIQYLLKEHGLSSILCYHGEIDKANILKMIELFNINPVNTSALEKLDCENDYLILVDCQRNNGNVYDTGLKNILVIDHHVDENKNYIFSDIRSNIGACSTIISEYFIENNIAFPKNVAGALLYGINIDTNNLGRCTSRLDTDIFYVLVNICDPKDLSSINLSQIHMSDIKYYAEGLSGIEKFDVIAFASIRECNDALLGTIGDLTLSVEGIEICVINSIRKDGIKFSIRSTYDTVPANELIQYIVKGIGSGGGHREMAGGFIPLENLSKLGDKQIDTYIKHRTISFVESRSGKKES